ncbi:SHOCT-like domain-containing protein [Paratissierella segnis]|jgi:hypothetical protein|uniref:YvlB/LiaX N-terminal domain-containing protein n=1 Tax=Paratissierella segnis TaxID=2763679 RepID=A0A926EX80_9FIRM|nr:hypothetical protein [Paratissierella segnis]MBC8588187.1 hypothetical protein [Paratissierella segnis]
MLEKEKMQILTMVKEGKVTTEEGVKLLDALDGGDTSLNDTNIKNGKKAKWLKVKVFDPEDSTKVNITLPISIINVGVKLAQKFSPEFKETGLTEDDMDEIFSAIKNGETGKILDVDSNDGTKVEVVVE